MSRRGVGLSIYLVSRPSCADSAEERNWLLVMALVGRYFTGSRRERREGTSEI